MAKKKPDSSASAQVSSPLIREMVHYPIKDLKNYHHNPRVGNVPMIAESLAKNGQFKPIVVQTSSSEILAGNHTFMAAKSLGWDTIAAVFVDVDDEEAKRIVLADNRTADLGEYNFDVMTDLLKGLESPDIGTGYDTEMLLDLLPQPVEYEEEEAYEDNLELDEGETVFDGVVGEVKSKCAPPPVRYPSSNDWEIPDLDPDLIYDLDDLHVETWAGPDLMDEVVYEPDRWVYCLRSAWAPSTKGLEWENTIGCLFTDDTRFEDSWDTPGKFADIIKDLGIAAMIDADYSAWDNSPLVPNAYSFYRARYIARYWQDMGIPVIPIIGTLLAHDGQNLATLGIPKGIPSACINLQLLNRGTEDNAGYISAIRRGLHETEPRTLLVYGSEPARKMMKKVGWGGQYTIIEPMNRKRRRINRGLPNPSRLDED